MKLLPRINPVTLKELRQLVRSRLVVWGMMVLPLVYLTFTGLVLSAEMRGIDPVEATYGKGLGTGPLAATKVVKKGGFSPENQKKRGKIEKSGRKILSVRGDVVILHRFCAKNERRGSARDP